LPNCRGSVAVDRARGRRSRHGARSAPLSPGTCGRARSSSYASLCPSEERRADSTPNEAFDDARTCRRRRRSGARHAQTALTAADHRLSKTCCARSESKLGVSSATRLIRAALLVATELTTVSRSGTARRCQFVYDHRTAGSSSSSRQRGLESWETSSVIAFPRVGPVEDQPSHGARRSTRRVSLRHQLAGPRATTVTDGSG